MDELADMRQRLEAMRRRLLSQERELATWKVRALFPRLEGEERVRQEERLAVAETLRSEADLWRNKPTLAGVLRQLAMDVEKGTPCEP